MGGGISILSDTDGEMILKYNKDVDLDKVIDIIQSRRILSEKGTDNNGHIIDLTGDSAIENTNNSTDASANNSAIDKTNNCADNSTSDSATITVDNTTVQAAEPVVTKLLKSPSALIDSKKAKSKVKLNSSSSEKRLPSQSLKKIPSVSPSSPRSFSPIKVINNQFTSPVSTKSKSGRRKSFGTYAELASNTSKKGLPTIHSPTPLSSSLAILISPGNIIYNNLFVFYSSLL